MKVGEIYDKREEEREEAYKEGYRQGRADAIDEYTCHDDCINENCSMCRRWDGLADYYEMIKDQKE